LSKQAWHFIVLSCQTAIPQAFSRRGKNEEVTYENDDPGLFSHDQWITDGGAIKRAGFEQGEDQHRSE
jgi:hypothetical protein